MVADSESDIYELLEATLARPENLHWLVRGCQNRALLANTDQSHTAIRETVQNEASLFTREIHVRARDAKVSCPKGRRKQARQARTAVTEVRVGCITLRPPYRHDRKLKPVAANVVLVSEIDTPAGEEPIEWMLLSSLPIDGKDTQEISRLALQIIDYYCVRWMIEVFFRVLKSRLREMVRLVAQLVQRGRKSQGTKPTSISSGEATAGVHASTFCPPRTSARFKPALFRWVSVSGTPVVASRLSPMMSDESPLIPELGQTARAAGPLPAHLRALRPSAFQLSGARQGASAEATEVAESGSRVHLG